MPPSDHVEILYEDNHCLAVNKPAGMLSQPDATGDSSLIDWAAADLKRRYHKPGNVFVGLVHRLDRPVSGLVLLAKTSKAADRLSAQFRDGTIRKTYWAIVEGVPPESSGTWEDRLDKDERTNTTRCLAASPEGPGRIAVVDYRILENRGRVTWLELVPRTGRSHQLRVQLASRELPILGDRKYGAKRRIKALDGGYRIALHAFGLEFRHPTRGEAIAMTATVPADWPGGGSPGARP